MPSITAVDDQGGGCNGCAFKELHSCQHVLSYLKANTFPLCGIPGYIYILEGCSVETFMGALNDLDK